MALFSLPFWFAGVMLGKQTLGSALVKVGMAAESSTAMRLHLSA